MNKLRLELYELKAQKVTKTLDDTKVDTTTTAAAVKSFEVTLVHDECHSLQSPSAPKPASNEESIAASGPLVYAARPSLPKPVVPAPAVPAPVATINK